MYGGYIPPFFMEFDIMIVASRVSMRMICIISILTGSVVSQAQYSQGQKISHREDVVDEVR